MQFSSKPPFNDDPEPWARFPDKGAGGVRSPKNPKGYLYWNPRPEYERPQHNPTNPILARFRERIEKTGEEAYWGDNWDATMDYLDHAIDFSYHAKEPLIQLEHARRVLTRLATARTKEESR